MDFTQDFKDHWADAANWPDGQDLSAIPAPPGDQDIQSIKTALDLIGSGASPDGGQDYVNAIVKNTVTVADKDQLVSTLANYANPSVVNTVVQVAQAMGKLPSSAFAPADPSASADPIKDAEDYNRAHTQEVVIFDRATQGNYAKRNGELDAEGVMAWQQAHGVTPADGKVSPQTIAEVQKNPFPTPMAQHQPTPPPQSDPDKPAPDPYMNVIIVVPPEGAEVHLGEDTPSSAHLELEIHVKGGPPGSHWTLYVTHSFPDGTSNNMAASGDLILDESGARNFTIGHNYIPILGKHALGASVGKDGQTFSNTHIVHFTVAA